MTIAKRIAELGLSLPEPPETVGNYLPYKLVNVGSVSSLVDWAQRLPVINGMLYLSGQIPLQDGTPYKTGKLGAEVSVKEGQDCARICTINALGWAAKALDGNLDRIIEVVNLRGYVAGTPDFVEQPQVINGASDLLAEIFGRDGKHCRAVVGAASLPMDVPVEIEFFFSIR